MRLPLFAVLALTACPSSPVAPTPDPTSGPTRPPDGDGKTPALQTPSAVCLPHDGNGELAPEYAIEGGLFRYAFDGHQAAFDIVKGAFVSPPPTPIEMGDASEPEPDPIEVSEDYQIATICPTAPNADDCIGLKPGGGIDGHALDRAGGRIWLGLHDDKSRVGSLVGFTLDGAKRVVTRKFDPEWTVQNIEVRGPDVLEVLLSKYYDSPIERRVFLDSKTLKDLANRDDYVANAHFTWFTRDPATWKIARRVDLWPLYGPEELRSPWWDAPSHGPSSPALSAALPNGELLIVPVGGAAGTLAVVDQAKGRIVRYHRLPVCEAAAAEPLQCLPSGVELREPTLRYDVFEACAGDDCYAFDVVAAKLARRARLWPERDTLGAGFREAIDPGLERDGPTCDGNKVDLGAPVSGAVYGRWADAVYLVTAGGGRKPASLSRWPYGTCKASHKVVVGSKAHPCARVTLVGDALMVATDDCSGTPGGAFLVDGKTLKRVAAIGPEHDFSIGHGASFGAFLFDDIGAFATADGSTVAFQHVTTGAIVGTATLPAPASGAAARIDPIGALWGTPVGDVLVQRGLSFTRVSVDGTVGATSAIPICP